MWRIYLKGLPESVGTEVWRYPVPQTFPELVAKTLSVVKEKGTHNDIWGRAQKNWGNQRFQQDRTTGNRPSFSNNQRFNSSNAPRSFNDQPVDMDLSRTRANRKGQWTRAAKADVKTHCLFGSSGALFLTGTKRLKAEPKDEVG